MVPHCSLNVLGLSCYYFYVDYTVLVITIKPIPLGKLMAHCHEHVVPDLESLDPYPRNKTQVSR